MTRLLRGQLRSVFAWGLVLLLGAQLAAPHAHAAASGHESEICEGHLGSHGDPDSQHDAPCLLCRTGGRQRLLATPTEAAAADPQPPITWLQRDGSLTLCPRAVLENAAPRGPPSLRLRS